MLTQIINGNILVPQGWLKGASVIFQNDKILEVTERNLEIPEAVQVDAKGMYVVPGWIDLHIHGGGGYDFMNGTPEAFDEIIKTHLMHGTTGIFSTLAASSLSMIEHAADEITRRLKDRLSPVLGLHLEGPYLNPVMAGGQMPEYLRQVNPDEYISLIGRYPCIKRWDAAPEMDGAMSFGKYVSDKGVLVGLAHTVADYEILRKAYKMGYTHATHFYNGMQGFHKQGEYKHEGTVESVYLLKDMTVELIADGKHVPPPILRLVYEIKGPERTCLVTDALAPAGCDGTTAAFDNRVIIEDGVAKLADHSALAGSVATMDKLLRVMNQETGIPLMDVVRMASETPAKIMGVYGHKGSLQKGKDADILILDSELNVCSVWQMGRFVKNKAITSFINNFN